MFANTDKLGGGFFGHRGRPGQRGGSLPKTGGGSSTGAAGGTDSAADEEAKKAGFMKSGSKYLKSGTGAKAARVTPVQVGDDKAYKVEIVAGTREVFSTTVLEPGKAFATASAKLKEVGLWTALVKHAGGGHDQKTHGRRGGGGGGGAGGGFPAAAEAARQDAIVDLQEQADAYMDDEDDYEPGEAEEMADTYMTAARDLEAGKTLISDDAIDIIQLRQSQFEDMRGDGEEYDKMADSYAALVNTLTGRSKEQNTMWVKLLKHVGGGHDQKTHGRRGSSVSSATATGGSARAKADERKAKKAGFRKAKDGTFYKVGPRSTAEITPKGKKYGVKISSSQGAFFNQDAPSMAKALVLAKNNSR